MKFTSKNRCTWFDNSSHINYKTKICSTVMNSLSHNLICLLKAYNKKPDSYETSGLIVFA
ncbi:hypothetical protein EIZ95_22045 [Escherichia coli]|nr:hypothetical protein [Escherichia coli]QRF34325.1 hypothetical protein BWZ24_00390 [Escherichia coli]UMW97580.1 Glycerol uptake facilitator protein [Escherichia coli]